MPTTPLKTLPVLVTGAAGFIGFHLSRRLLTAGWKVIGLDNLNPYYDVSLKEARLAQLVGHDHFSFHKMNLEDREAMGALFASNPFGAVVNLAAQAGVRYSLNNPRSYVESNIVGFLNVLEGCRHHGVKHLVYASSSSVYGLNTRMPFSPHQIADHPVSLYAATKRANELMAHSYAHLYGLPCTGLRFFTVYGPWGRPDMALFKFTKAILAREPIELYNRGEMVRDFTFVDDIVEGVARIMEKPPAPAPGFDPAEPDPCASSAPFAIYNIGNNRPVPLMEFVEAIEESLGRRAEKRYLPMQAGDVGATFADVTDLMDAVGFRPKTSVADGIRAFVTWYLSYYGDTTAAP
jgi:UDP-glucuronate 4-epimerase